MLALYYDYFSIEHYDKQALTLMPLLIVLQIHPHSLKT